MHMNQSSFYNMPSKLFTEIDYKNKVTYCEDWTGLVAVVKCTCLNFRVIWCLDI